MLRALRGLPYVLGTFGTMLVLLLLTFAVIWAVAATITYWRLSRAQNLPPPPA